VSAIGCRGEDLRKNRKNTKNIERRREIDGKDLFQGKGSGRSFLKGKKS